MPCGRLRRSESGRPFIKCNDCGARFIEAKCDMSMNEFLELNDCSLQNRLVYNQVIGPELTLSPLVMIQITGFKCGGMSVGLRWAHILGDAFSATEFMNAWGQVLATENQLPKSLDQKKSQLQTQVQISANENLSTFPLSVKQVDPVGDHWLTPNNCKMGTLSFQITATQLTELQSKLSGQSQNGKLSHFVSISAVLWKCLAKIRGESEPSIVTICRSKTKGRLGNNPILSVIKVDYSIANLGAMELAALIMDQKVDESSQIEQVAEKNQGLADSIVYGANLTFVDLEEANLYGLELKGMKPVFANYIAHGVGDEGVLLVLPSRNGGRTVTITVPESQVSQLKALMKKEWNIC
ncbi:hypothetical protein IFM89_023133 [Coptis chinensis]|nr:hypothetical protein IFM89_023133 [Coptis chinensis]